MKILLINPCYPETFWSFTYALRFIARRATFPPLSLLTVAALLPAEWELRLIDENVKPVADHDLRWADYVFLSAISVQKDHAKRIIARCAALGVKVVAGGPLFTMEHDAFPEVDHFVLNEAEVTLPTFLDDLRHGCPQHIYTNDERADIRTTPLPRWDLINLHSYASMSIQYSRGCPFDCAFCDITVLYGRKPRTKTSAQLLAELESLYARGYRGGIFFVDDNFIGHKEKLKREVLPALIAWMEEKNHPFSLCTEASINLADDDELLQLMLKAGFETVFVGIESPNADSLDECEKRQNQHRDLTASVRKIQQHGLQVQGGFIVGFDHDPLSIFHRMVDFIQESGIVVAMVGLLNAPHGTRLYHRLQEEGRITDEFSGDNTNLSMNFSPKMPYDKLIAGYQQILHALYSPKQYYARVTKMMQDIRPAPARVYHFKPVYLRAFWQSIIVLGVLGKERWCYWKLFFWSLFTRPHLFPMAIVLSIYGYHFRKIVEKQLKKVQASSRPAIPAD
ncbi:MAG: B12-binding domain-containing radical SAM protein [Armatimonadota bacterium]